MLAARRDRDSGFDGSLKWTLVECGPTYYMGNLRSKNLRTASADYKSADHNAVWSTVWYSTFTGEREQSLDLDLDS